MIDHDHTICRLNLQLDYCQFHMVFATQCSQIHMVFAAGRVLTYRPTQLEL